ncbi:MAG: penicillin-binding transpeptidase domain-containing protein, partial [Lachnospiraceae bacterium]|nr:penicillin-binding transpeptidase domain-containing protein [Lachnospiraceae bacterium]
ATDTTRQPGSCFKVLAAFAPAIDSYGYTIASTIDDSPYYYENGRLVNNWWDNPKKQLTADSRTYRGLQSIRTAIANSMNVVTVKVLDQITPSAGYAYLKEFGFTTLVDSRKNADGTYDTDIIQSLALGGVTDGVTNMELCAAYATIANGGEYTEPLYYTKVLDNSGKIILEREPERRQVLKESTAYILTDAMHGVVTAGGTGTKANLDNMYVAGKTGTTSNSYDIWFAGYTPYLTGTIWSGYDQNVLMDNTSYHLVIWKNIMGRVHELKGYGYAEFERPESVVSAQVCKKCGQLATLGLCDKDPEKNMITTELFIAGTVPTERCVCHEEVSICNDSGLLATENCTNVTKKIFRIRYQGTEGKTWDTPYTRPENLKDEYCHLHP